MLDNEFRSGEWIDKIETLVARAQSLPDTAARAVVIDLLQAVLDFHGAALDHLLELLAASHPELIPQLAADGLISSMLLLHDLHPDDVETRVRGALDKLNAMFRSLGAELSLIAIEPGSVSLRFHAPRTWSGTPVRASVENAIFEAAPEISNVVIDGLAEPALAGFVPLSSLLPAHGVPDSHL